MSSKEPYTQAEFKRFDQLTEDMCSRDQMTRISARLALNKFVKERGKEKCDLMWAKIKKASKQ